MLSSASLSLGGTKRIKGGTKPLGKFFNEHLMHARHWPQRGKETLAQELMGRRRRKTTELTEEPGDSGALTTPKRVGGRPRLDIAVNGVLRSLSEGKSKSEIARELGRVHVSDI